MKRIGIAMALALVACSLAAIEFVEVIDADTIRVRDGKQEWDAQVYGIDAPEVGEPFGEYARGVVLIAFARGASVRRAEFDPMQIDVSTAAGPLAVELARLGLARVVEDSRHWMWLRAWESEPRDMRIGIWSE